MSEGLVTLDGLLAGERFVVNSVCVNGCDPAWEGWLAEIGFVTGEPGQVMARGIPGGDPLAVRIGLSTFALRRAEAACIRVRVVERAEYCGRLHAEAVR